MQDVPCQNDGLASFSDPVPRISVLAHRTLWVLKREGPVATLRKISGFVMRRILSPFRRARTGSAKPFKEIPDATLDLEAGEWVEVKTEEEILKTVDSDWRTRGLQFVPEMREYFGRRLRVMKQVQRICIENAEGNIGEVRSLKNTVLLEGAMCKGAGIGCDRSCHYFWREAWLKRVKKD